MLYRNIKKAVFLKRPNRFVAHVLVDGVEEIVHVKNTGRCKEILKEGASVILEEASNPDRKTRYSLISVYKEDVLINIDSQVPNAVVYEAIKLDKIEELQGIKRLKREAAFMNSRFDLYFETEESKGFIEVKGVTLERNGTAMFPDAPTERGTKHMYELIKSIEKGYSAYVFFLIQMKGTKVFVPNKEMDGAFAEALKDAVDAGVKVLVYDSVVNENSITIGSCIDINFT